MRAVFVILCSFGVLCLIPRVWTARCITGDEMGIDFPSSYTNQLDNQAGQQYVVSTFTSPCCGVLTGWKFYVGRTGTVYLQIWRDAGSSTYTLIGQSSYILTADSYEETTTLTIANRIPVVSGDLIGWYSSDPDIITYQNMGPDDGFFQTTNTVPAVGSTIAQPSSDFINRRYAVKASLGPGNSPSFSNLDGSVTVSCQSASLGAVVYTVIATDADIGDVLTVTLDSVTPSSHFAFNSGTGDVTVSTGSITVTTYTLTFTVNDGCSTTTNTLTVTVSNTVPSFSNLDGSVSIACFTPLGSPVFTVTVVDADTANGDVVTVTLNSVSPSVHFSFDDATGVVSVSTSALTTGIYALSFTATDSCGQGVTNTLTITVIQNDPYFSNLDAVITTPSNLAVGTVMYAVTSVDDDISNGDVLTTTLDSTLPTSDFAFNVTSGEVSTLTTPLTIGSYTLTFTVTDACAQSATNTLTITVFNRAPVITSLPTTVDVREDATSATLLHTVTVTDVDEQPISCVISSTTPASAPFSMKFISNGTQLDNGIYLNSNPGLDYSSVDTYTLDISCTDGYDTDTEILYVYIVQNGMPLISNLQNVSTVSTTTSISTEVFVVLAEDVEADPLTFALSCVGTSTCPFAIYSTGSVLLSSSLLGTTTLAYEVDITASDGYSTTTAHRLTVFVSDLNTPPVLANLPQTVQVSEDITLGTSLFLLSVYDEDGDTTFTLDVTYTPTAGVNHFVIDDATLTVSLSTAQGLDYEIQSQYTLNLTASDGTDTSPWALLTIQVADVKEPPTLTKTYYYVSENEGPAGTTFTVPVIEASDPDIGDTLTFSLENGSSPSCGLLSINSATGLMGYETDFDVDDTSLSSKFTCLIKVEDTSGLAVTATVTLSIQDINDNQPQFATDSYFTSINQSGKIGTVLYTLSILDNDVTAINQITSYTMSQSATYFSLSSTGVVTLANDVSIVAIGTTLTATISISNIGYNVSDTLTIYLTIVADDNESFWDSGANIAWVTLTCVMAVLLAALTAFLVYRFKSRCFKGPSKRFFKIQPKENNTRVTPRPREDYMRHPYNDNPRSLTPTDVHLTTGRWDAWSASGGAGWRP